MTSMATSLVEFLRAFSDSIRFVDTEALFPSKALDSHSGSEIEGSQSDSKEDSDTEELLDVVGNGMAAVIKLMLDQTDQVALWSAPSVPTTKSAAGEALTSQLSLLKIEQIITGDENIRIGGDQQCSRVLTWCRVAVA